MAVPTILAMHLGRRLGRSRPIVHEVDDGIGQHPWFGPWFSTTPEPSNTSPSVRLFENALYLDEAHPGALSALKLKEISYIHAGYLMAEMKHGSIALTDEAMPVVFIATQDEVYEKVVSNIQEVKARGANRPSSPKTRKFLPWPTKAQNPRRTTR